MKIYRTVNTILLMIGLWVLAPAVHAQSTDIDNPTTMTANVIEGEGDGKGETLYYCFTATKGDVKLTIDAKTDKYSTPLRVMLLDENGKELLPVYVVAKDGGQREVATRHFVREQKVIVKIMTQDDVQVKLLSYKIKFDGAIKVEAPAPSTEGAPSAEQPNTSSTTGQNAGTESPAATAAGQTTPTPNMKSKVKTKVKNSAKQALRNIIDD